MDFGVYLDVPRRVRRRLATQQEKLDVTVGTLWRIAAWVVAILAGGGLVEWLA